MHRLVEKFAGKITQKSGTADCLRFYFVDQSYIGRRGICLETRCDSRDIYQVVGFENYEFRIECVIFPLSGNYVDLGSGIYRRSQIREVIFCSGYLVVKTNLDKFHLF